MYLKLTFATMIVISIVSCTVPFDPAIIEPRDVSFNGIHPSSMGEEESTVVMIHGMCHTDINWFRKRGGAIADEFNMKIDLDTRKSDKEMLVEEISNGIIGRGNGTLVKAYKMTLYDDRYKINLYGIIYSEATKKNKIKYLCNDVKSESPAESTICKKTKYTRERAVFNNTIKNKLLNDCLADAIIYLGETGLNIQAGVKLALAKINDDHDKQSRPHPIIIISSSLGSKILRDALLCKSDERSNKGLQLMAKTTHVFLSANQNPLLNLGNHHKCEEKITVDYLETEIEQKGDFSDVTVLLNKLRGLDLDGFETLRDKTPLVVVSFTDPNDLLSYEINKGNYVAKKVANVIVSNGYTWVSAIENPLQAHTGYLENNQVFDLVACGYNNTYIEECNKNR